MTLNQLKYFCELAKYEHYGKAAQILYISQPSLSKAIKNLEEELGVELFSPNGRRVTLTQAGKLFYYQIIPILEQLDNACRSMEQFKNQSKQYSIGCISPAITSVFTPMIDLYKRNGNHVPKLSLTVGSSEELINDLIKGKHDLVFCTRIPNIGEVNYDLIARLPYAVVMRKDDPLVKQDHVTPQDLNGRDMVFSNSVTYASNIQRMLQHYKSIPIIKGVANDDSALVGMWKAGIGIFITNDYPAIHTEDLIVKELKQDLEYREIYMAYTDRSIQNIEISQLIQFIRNNSH